MQGATGLMGATGEAGPAGAQGYTTTLNFVGEYDNYRFYEVGEIVSFGGTLYWCVLPAAYNVDPYTTTNWAQLQISVNGATGATGQTGDQGSTGSTGPEGSTGEQGIPGISDRYYTSSLTYQPISVGQKSFEVELGLNYVANQNVIISYAENGEAYFKGKVTAYTASGFPVVGILSVNVTEAIGADIYGTDPLSGWLITLDGAVGAIGATGQTGATGEQGIEGPSGPQGIQGIKGDQGDIGPSGPIGQQGATGPQGPQGATGIGATGPQGATGAKGDPGSPGGATGATGIFPDYLPNPIKEKALLYSGITPGGTIPIYLKEKQLHFFSGSISGNFNFLFTADSDNSLDTMISAGDAISATIVVWNSDGLMSSPVFMGAGLSQSVYSHTGEFYQAESGQMSVYSFTIFRMPDAGGLPAYTTFVSQSTATYISSGMG
jgi:hypothetical protein